LYPSRTRLVPLLITTLLRRGFNGRGLTRCNALRGCMCAFKKRREMILCCNYFKQLPGHNGRQIPVYGPFTVITAGTAGRQTFLIKLKSRHVKYAG
jgi:hypothetical protein